jgi:hypothetical protein
VTFCGTLFYFAADMVKQEVIEYSDQCPPNEHFYSNYRTVVKTPPLYD